MRHRRAVVTAVVGLAGSLLVGSAAGTSVTHSPAAPGVPVSAVAELRPSADSSAHFVAPLYVAPSAPAGVPAPESGGEVLTPGTVQLPDSTPAPRLAPRAEFRPA